MSEIDIVPELLEEIANDFKEQFKNNSKIINIWGKIKSKMVSYQDANEFAIECGEMLAKSYSKFISVDTLPEGRMWFNIASRILEPTLRTNYSLITDVCNEAQTLMNEEMGLGLKAITPPINQNRIDGLINKVSNAENYEDVEWVLQEPIVNISQSMVDEYMKTNAEFHYQSGLTPKIVRKAESGACKWCLGLVGEYEYPAVPSDVYRRHENCRCTVEYIRDGKYRQNVYSKEWANGNMPPEERERQAYQRYQARERQWAREQEKRGVAKLMREHPDWSESGATIYYRTNIANTIPKTKTERILFSNQSSNNFDQFKKKYGVRISDATRLFFNEATPYKGNIDYEKGTILKNKQSEIVVANILHNSLGGDILIRKESKIDGIKTPDYRWLETDWELKSPEGIGGVDGLIRKGIKQIRNNPGGIILDFSNNDYSLADVLEMISYRVSRSGSNSMPLNIMIIDNNKIRKILEFDK